MKCLSRGLVLVGLLLAACRATPDQRQQPEPTGPGTRSSGGLADPLALPGAARWASEANQATARAGFSKRRDDYRHVTMVQLSELDREIDRIQTRLRAARGGERAELETSLLAIYRSRARFSKAYAELENTAPGDWDEAKRALDAQWAGLKELVDEA